MASGSSGRTGSKGGFGSDDNLRSYEDMLNPDISNANHSDSVNTNTPGKNFHETRTGRSFSHEYEQRADPLHQDLILTVERTMKKYADNLLRFLEGISARLQQLELYCNNLEKSIGEMRTELTQENSEADSKLRSLEKHLQEVHRSVQILRDKQELAETQKELAKLHVQKEPSLHEDEVIPSSGSDIQKTESTQVQSQQLALTLPHQVNPSVSLASRPMEQQHQSIIPSSQSTHQNVQMQTQQPTYYQQNQLTNLPPQAQAQNQPQGHYLQGQQQQPHPPESHRSQPQQVQQFPQQWTQQVQQQPQPPAAQSQMGPQTQLVYTPYLPTRPVTQPTLPVNPPPETYPSSSMPMQVNFPGVPQPGMNGLEPAGYGYAGYVASLKDGSYTVSEPPLTQPLPAQPPPRQGYMIYEGEQGRVPHSMASHYSQSRYPPTHISSPQNQSSTNRHSGPSPPMRIHPYSELIEKVVNMGYGRELVTSVIQRLDENQQPVDFNSVLDRLNVQAGGSQRGGWSG